MSATETATQTRTSVTVLTVAAWSSLGAGAIHAAAIGLHAEERQAALVFTAVAIFQIGWGVLALAVQNRLVAAVGAAGNAALVGGWVLAQTSGIGFVEGMEAAHAAQVPDTIAALLAGAAVLLSVGALSRPHREPRQTLDGAIGFLGVVAVVGLTIPGLISASDHTHDHGEAAADHGHDASDDHGHGGADDHPTGDPTGDHDTGDHDTGDHDTSGHHAAAAPKPYDPDLPIDLSGTDGVTPQQQAAAENLIAVTLLRLPQFADPAAAEAAGFHSIQDGFTGHEHYINWDYIDDGRFLDPDHPESLVYQVRGGEKTLVAAMYMLGSDDTLDDVPDMGGDLMQWHVHENLCFTDDPVAPVVAGLTQPDGTCAPPLVPMAHTPMIHVWTVPHECGPFAALEGIAGGQIPVGEERLCDHAHGA